MTAYYNEIDPGAAAWLRELIKAGQIAAGDVDERSIEDVQPDDLRGYAQCHFFAGIGGWSLALRRAGWDDARPVWTGSCPCQPFSSAGAGKGFADERHLWPVWMRLIATCSPDVIFGEQVASKGVVGYANEGLYGVRGGQTPRSVSEIFRQREARIEAAMQGVPEGVRKDLAVQFDRGVKNDESRVSGAADAQDDGATGGAWIDLVFSDLEGSGYACAAVALPSSSVGAPHIRQRLYWVARSNGSSGWMGDADRNRAWRDRGAVHSQIKAVDGKQRADDAGAPSGDLRPGPLHGHWRDADWLGCRDGKWRPVEPGTFPLAHGLPRGLVRGGDQRLAPNSSAEGRVMRLRGYGNAIVPQVAEAFIRASGVIA